MATSSLDVLPTSYGTSFGSLGIFQTGWSVP
jgi:hypothetical protein